MKITWFVEISLIFSAKWVLLRQKYTQSQCNLIHIMSQFALSSWKIKLGLFVVHLLHDYNNT